jgi:hypothetical protein
MKKIFAFLFAMSMITQVFPQTEKFDIATFIPPQGWQRLDSNGVLAFHDYRTADGLTSFGQIVLFPSWASKNTPAKNFQQEWDNRVVKSTGANTKPTTKTEKTPDGWTVVTGTANLSVKGLNYACVLVTASGFKKVMSVMVNMAGSDHASMIEKFFNDLNLDSKAAISTNQTNMSGTISRKDYDFTAPEKWQVQNNTDHIAFINPKSGCTIKILSPQPSSGNPEQDANAVFDLMYKGWNYQKSGDRKFILAKGFLPKGPEFFIKEATMSGTNAQGLYSLEEGTAMVIKAGNQVVIISVRHNSSNLGHDDCYQNYNTWKRFVNSFTIKNIALPKNNEQQSSPRIIGLWKIDAVGVVTGDYIFAANGNYQSGGGIGSSTTTSDMYYTYIYNRAYPFEGDGSYSTSGKILRLNKKGTNTPEEVTIRFEKVNHGGAGWKDRLYMLKKDNYGENESLYEKQEK